MAKRRRRVARLVRKLVRLEELVQFALLFGQGIGVVFSE